MSVNQLFCHFRRFTERQHSCTDPTVIINITCKVVFIVNGFPLTFWFLIITTNGWQCIIILTLKISLLFRLVCFLFDICLKLQKDNFNLSLFSFYKCAYRVFEKYCLIPLLQSFFIVSFFVVSNSVESICIHLRYCSSVHFNSYNVTQLLLACHDFTIIRV